MSSRRIERWTLPLLALLPLALYAIFGYRGQDFRFHITSWMELHKAWAAHEWRLGWAQGAFYGFGEPRFCFYPPLSLLLGAGLSFLVPMRFAPAISVWAVLSVSGIAMYYTAGRLVAPKYRFRAALLYMLNCYLLLTLLVRYAIAEAWVQALLPLILLYFCLAVEKCRLRAVPMFAFLLAIGWLTNIPASIIIFYSFGFAAFVVSLTQRSVKPLLFFGLSQGAAFCTAAFRLIPVVQEKGWVSANALVVYNFREQLPFGHLKPYTASVCDLYMIAVLPLVAMAAYQIRRAKGIGNAYIVPLTLCCIAVFFQTPLSAILWAGLPELKFVSFPFRFLPLLSLGVVLLLFADGVGRKVRLAGTFMLALNVLPIVFFLMIAPYLRYSSFNAVLSRWEKGYDGQLEYVPVEVTSSRTWSGDALATNSPFASDACRSVLLSAFPNQRIIATDGITTCTLTLNTFYYPFWKASLENGSSLSVSAAGGLISVTVPQGEHQVKFSFVPSTRTRTVSAAISFVTLLTILVCIFLSGRSPAMPLARNESEHVEAANNT